MLPDLRQRSEAAELMDDLQISGTDLFIALRELRFINMVLGGPLPTLEGVWRLWHAAGKPAQLRLLDVGAGSGETSRLLLHWADWQGLHIEITLLDIHPLTCAIATAEFADEPRVQVRQGNMEHLPPASTDIVTASLVLHHFPTAALPRILGTLQAAAHLGVIINDLHRHPLAWCGIDLFTRLFSRNRMIRHDARLSVARGFRAADFEALRCTPALHRLHYRWRPVFRYLVILPGAQL